MNRTTHLPVAITHSLPDRETEIPSSAFILPIPIYNIITLSG
jgi:hypothetical protein